MLGGHVLFTWRCYIATKIFWREYEVFLRWRSLVCLSSAMRRLSLEPWEGFSRKRSILADRLRRRGATRVGFNLSASTAQSGIRRAQSGPVKHSWHSHIWAPSLPTSTVSMNTLPWPEQEFIAAASAARTAAAVHETVEAGALTNCRLVEEQYHKATRSDNSKTQIATVLRSDTHLLLFSSSLTESANGCGKRPSEGESLSDRI